jgi:hypothetical protein
LETEIAMLNTVLSALLPMVVTTASLIEVWIDETERCTWFLSKIRRGKQQ